MHNFSPYNKQKSFLAAFIILNVYFRLARKGINGLGSLLTGNEIRSKINILKHKIMLNWHIICHVWFICVSTSILGFRYQRKYPKHKPELGSEQGLF